MQVGRLNLLTVEEPLPFGWHLRADDGAMVLLPAEEATALDVGQQLEAFVYHDRDDRLAASLKHPHLMLGDVGVLSVNNVTDAGAFLDWGIERDLFVPARLQHTPMQQGLSYVVYLLEDPYSGKVMGSSRLHDKLPEKNGPFEPRQPVSLLICDKTPMGFKAVINQTHLGLVFKDEVFQALHVGDQVDGFIKRIREDGKIDLCFQFHDQQARGDLGQQILDDLVAHGGISTLTDKSDPEEISRRFGVSKGAYKKALGALYRQKRIVLDKSRITLIEK